MSTLKQIIEASDKEFNDKFVALISGDEHKSKPYDVIFIDDIPKGIKAFLRERDRKILEGVRKDLLEIADSGEYEELRREVEYYFSRILI